MRLLMLPALADPVRVPFSVVAMFSPSVCGWPNSWNSAIRKPSLPEALFSTSLKAVKAVLGPPFT